MELGFQFNVESCNVNVVIGFICVMVMAIVLFVCVKGTLSKLVFKNKKKEDKDYFDFLESSGEDGKE